MTHKISTHHHANIPLWFFALLLPLFYFNMNSCFDWGDDYAQYLLQAKHFATGKPQYNAEMPGIQVYSPICRPAGFPLLLSPFYFLFKENALGYMFLMTILLAGLALVYFLFLRSYTSSLITALLVLVFIYNPQTLRLKSEVLAEIPLTLCITAVLYLSHQHKKWFILLLTLFAMMLKYAGIVLWLALILYEFTKAIFKTEGSKKHKPDYFFLFYLVCIPVVYVLINHVIFVIPFVNETWYNSLFFNSQIFETIKNNSVYYTGVFSDAFEQEVPYWYNALLKIGITLFFLSGFISKLKERVGAGDIFFVLYIFMILAYPYSKGGYRFIFPVLPLVILYLYCGMNFYFVRIKDYSVFPIVIFLMFILVSYTVNIKLIQEKNCQTISGTHEKDFKEAIIHCNALVSADAAILFARPWALKYSSDINASPVINEWSVNEFANHINHYQLNFILVCKSKKHELYQQGLTDFITSCDSCKVIWQNQTFCLYER